MTPQAVPEPIGFTEALARTLTAIEPVDTVTRPLMAGAGCVTAARMQACVDAPSADCAMKDGFACRSRDIAAASAAHPVTLTIRGFAAAGTDRPGHVEANTAVRILTGAGLPQGADTVVARERTHVHGNTVTLWAPAAPGQDVMPRGSDVRKGETIVAPGMRVTPGRIGLLAAAGCTTLTVYRNVRIFLLAVGTEIAQHGQPLKPGQLYASNVAALSAWCDRYRMETVVGTVADDTSAIVKAVQSGIARCDALITSGGSWTGDRDLVADALDALAWEKAYHRIRLKPGKGAGFGRLSGKPVFVLPGGPTANQAAFALLALPGLLKLSGLAKPELPKIRTRLGAPIQGRTGWTQAVFGQLAGNGSDTFFYPLKSASRLKAMASAEAVLLLAEDADRMDRGKGCWAQALV